MVVLTWAWTVVCYEMVYLLTLFLSFSTPPMLYIYPLLHTIATIPSFHTIATYHCYTPLLHTIVTHHCQTTMAQHHFHLLHKNSRLLVSSKNCTGTKNEGSTCPISPIPGNRQTYGYLNAHPTLTPLAHILCSPQSGHGGQIVGGLPKCDGVGLFAVRH